MWMTICQFSKMFGILTHTTSIRSEITPLPDRCEFVNFPRELVRSSKDTFRITTERRPHRNIGNLIGACARLRCIVLTYKHIHKHVRHKNQKLAYHSGEFVLCISSISITCGMSTFIVPCNEEFHEYNTKTRRLTRQPNRTILHIALRRMT